jgi:hypothetical protein
MKTTRENAMNPQTSLPKSFKQGSMRPMKSLFGPKSAKPNRLHTKILKKHTVLGDLKEKFDRAQKK